jgi:hypothetical protein
MMTNTVAEAQKNSVQPVTALMRPRLVVALGEAAPLMPDFSQVTPWSDLLDPQGAAQLQVRAAAGQRSLFLHFHCPLHDNYQLMPRNAAVNSDYDRVWFEIHPQNDPLLRVRFECDYRGIHSASSQRRITGERSLEAVPDLWQSGGTISVLSEQWERYYGVERDSWWCQIELPWRTLGLEARPATIGFNFGRFYRINGEAPHMTLVAWPSATRESNCPTLLEHGELLIGPQAGAPVKLELPTLRFGVNEARIHLPPDWPAGEATLSAQVLRPGGAAAAAQSAPARAGAIVSVPFTLDRADSSHVEPFDVCRLALTVQDRGSGQTVYQAIVPMDRYLGLTVDEPYGEGGQGSGGTERERWLQRVVRLLPRLHRATTRQGAPSDFCLMNADDRLAVNLMADNAWSALASIVEQRFETAEDRLVAAMALVGQKSVANMYLATMFFENGWKPSYHSSMTEMMGPLSILRYGGGPPVELAVVLAELLRHITDPQTGKPFSTRVASLDKDGGPRQTAYNRNAGRVLSYAQTPGSVGAVAVSVRGQQTLLDPAALAFFPAGPGRLASIEQIVSDESLRQAGAGRLAPIYARLDLEELLRHPADAILSKGVFPELCPDEWGPDRPFDPRERHELGDRVLVAPIGRSAKVSGFRDIFGRPGRRNGSVTVAPDSDGLVVCVEVEIDLGGCNPRDRAAECVNLSIDCKHTHLEFLTLSAWMEGDRRAFLAESGQIQTLFKHMTTSGYAERRELKDARWSATFANTSGGYRAEFRVPWKTLELDPAALPPTVGMNVWIDGRHPHYEQVFASTPRWMRAADAFTYMDLYLNPAPVVIRGIDLDVPKWGMNMAKVRLASTTGAATRAQVEVSNILGMSPRVRALPPVTVEVPASGEVVASVPYFVDPSEKMSGPQQRVTLAVTVGGQAVYRGAWRIGYCGPLSTYQRYGSQYRDEPRGLPAYEDPIIEGKVRQICGKLPVFRRLTTRDGAPSDFFLRSEDGRVEFNLMADGVLDQMGRYIAELFDNDLDRVLGMFFFNHAPWISRHMSSGHRFMEGAGPLSVLRGNFAGGGGNCGYHSRNFAGMMSHLRIGGQRVVAHTLGCWGHSIAAIGWRGSKVLFDPDVYHIFLNARGDDLATLEEMRSPAGIHTTAGPGDLARFRTPQDANVLMQKSIEHLNFYGVFPLGGSRE